MELNKNNIEDFKNSQVKQIDIYAIVSAMWSHRKIYFITLPIILIISSLLIICVPRYYDSTVKLAPELASFSTSSLGDLAASFGLDLNSSSSNGDAILPELYPDLMESNDFRTSLFDVKVKSLDGSISTTYYDYLATKQQAPWWSKVVGGIKSLFASKDTIAYNKNTSVTPFRLTKRQDEIARRISEKVSCTVDKKNYVISISVVDQDPLICATMADTVQVRLQQFITEYRTSKARKDLDYYKKLCSDAKSKYEKVRQAYGSYADANQDVLLESFKLKETDLENEMQLLYNNYTSLQNQVQQAQARLTLQTPAFTILQSASVPLKPSGPKRMLFVLGMCLLAFMGITVFSIRKVIFGEDK